MDPLIGLKPAATGDATASVGPPLPFNSSEKVNAVIHYYRGEMGRMTSWRDRIDRTSNWAITVVAALLSISLSTPSSHHGVIVFGMLIVSLLLLIEARRYRFFDVYRSRVRQLERYYFAQVLSPKAELNADWAGPIAQSLRKPSFFISYREAVFRRIRRNYSWMYLILLLAWGLKISSPQLLPDDTNAEVVNQWSDLVANAALGPVSGWGVLGAVAVLYTAVLAASAYREADDGEFAFGEAHV
ncbi:DUF2270 domain-containing protein [Rhizobium sp. Root483D2]|uniref:DUF2270 domain-containing protein n=1 Tax=Rhizobium sp. Root483D2 TaxID=1736545 RepID=UPI0007151FDD|nr:DUF2270 domain-containing protein [Rhizobium sp. Root483D2]KQY27811.1 hypothetical protein ASD32_24845 [Rhizobium sp. Root483D2]